MTVEGGKRPKAIYSLIAPEEQRMKLPDLSVLAVIGVLALGGEAHAAPPPPPPPGALERAARIITPPTAEEVPSYEGQFTEGLKVYENDKLVADGRAQWQSYLMKRTGLHITALNVSYGNPIIAVETINNMGPIQPGVVQDCCFWARVAAYHVGGRGLVDEVHFLTNGSYWGPPEHPQ